MTKNFKSKGQTGKDGHLKGSLDGLPGIKPTPPKDNTGQKETASSGATKK